ncbi:hypothetical protein [Roseibium sp.]|uniref:hypothetical protein n=1 Tax=Roseibium sp. TaxID=1936156 RepID=UPI003BAB14BA
MLRFPLIAAIAALSVMPATSALSDDTYKTVHVHNNTTYDFTNGYVEKASNSSVTGMPTSIPAGESRGIDVKIKHSSYQIDLHWQLSNNLDDNVAVKLKKGGANQPKECHTDVPEGIHSDHYNCSSKDPKFYFCDASDQSACDK